MFTLLGTATIFWIAVVSVVIIIVASEMSENGFIASAAILLFLTLMYFKGTYDLSWFSWALPIYYFAAGLIYCFVRTYFWGREQKRRVIKAEKNWHPVNPQENEKFTDSYNFRDIMSKTKLKNHFFRWWGYWPISLPLWFLGEFVKEFFIWLYDQMQEFIDGIRQRGYDSINEE